MLVQLFSETNLISKAIFFKSGINLILGKYSDEKDTKGINGIGKSSLVRLIDFALLSNSTETRFLQPKYNFLREENHSIVLELAIGGKKFFIKRTFEKTSPILFGEIFTQLEEYSKQELKTILSNKLFPFNNETYFEGEKYGTLMDFFIKDDLESQQRFDPLNFSQGTKNQVNKALYNFFLLGLPTKNILKYEELIKEHDSFNSTAHGLEDKIKIDQGKSIEEYKSQRIQTESKIELLEKSIQDYTFLENYKNIEKELVEITSAINEKLKDYHSLNRKYNKVQQAFQYNSNVDTQNIKKIFREVLSTFGDLVSKTLDDVILFKQEILENRNKFLLARERDLSKAIEKLLADISELEKKRSQLYKKLDEKGALESIKNTYEQLTLEKTELAGNLKILTELDDLQEMLGNLRVTISEIKRDILLDLKQNKERINNYRALFLEILRNAIFLDDDNPHGYFDISPKLDSSRNQLPFKFEIEIPKAEALGQSRLKIIAYDIMVFLKNIREDRLFPRFLIHDGVFHSISLNAKIKALNFMHRQFLAYPNFQYIVTFNEDEIYVPDERKEVLGHFEFDLEDVIIAKFTDHPREMLFKRDFK